MANHSKWTPEADADLIRMRSVDRETWTAIAAIFGLSKTTCQTRYVSIVPLDQQVTIKARFKWSNEDANRLHALRHGEKKTLGEIAAIFGMTVGQVSSKLERMRVPQKRIHFEAKNSSFIIPQRCLDDRDRRRDAQRDLTGQFFGDPPRGFSALDQRA